MAKVPETLRKQVHEQVARDLTPPRAIVHAKIGFGVGVGGLVSLFLCGQFGLGLSATASAAHLWIMESFDMLGCAVLCGTLFAVIPVACVRATCTALQFRAIVRHDFWTLVLWMIGFGALLALRGGVTPPVSELLAWCIAAIASFEILAHALDRLPARIVSRRS